MLDGVNEREIEDRRARLTGFVDKLQREAEARVMLRSGQEEIWIDDLRAYYGVYDRATWRNLHSKERAHKSKLHMGKSGTKTRAWISRLQDLLFPTDDKNWAIQPTPVPKLAREAADAQSVVEQAEAQAQSGGELAPEQAQAVSLAKQAQARIVGEQADARKRCDLMSDEMEDQLLEGRYAAESRDGIEQGCQLGTAIWEGPVVDGPARRWVRTEGGFSREETGDARPKFLRVDIWNFFPSGAATSIEDSDGFYIRYPWNDSQLRAFAKFDGVDRGKIREILKGGRKSSAPGYIQQLAQIQPDKTAQAYDTVHMVWKYVGPVAAEDMLPVALALGDEELATEAAKADPLDEMQVIAWFCDGQLLKIDPFPLDTDQPYFTRWTFEKGPGFWGIGVPYLIRNPEAALNAAWRLMMDNSEVSSLPQLFIDTMRIRPMDGSYVIRGGKLWQTKNEVSAQGLTGKEIYAVNIDSHQVEIANIIALAEKEIDELSMLPPLAQGEQGTGVTETAQGMALLMNANNVLLKRVVKNYDDDKTTPEIRKLYDWNMQYSTRDEVKGDYQVDARGSSVLLVREMQARNIITLALNFGAHPEYGPMTNKAELYREVYRVHQIPPDRFVMSDDEIEAQMSAQAEDPLAALEAQKLEIEKMKLDIMEDDSRTRAEISNMENDAKRYVADKNYDIAMIQAESRYNSDREKEAAQSEDKAADRRFRERSQAAEIALRSRPEAPLNDTRIDN